MFTQLGTAAASAKGSGGSSSGAGGLLGSVLSVFSGLYGNNQRKKAAIAQRNFAREMWEKQNAYNTPKMQMQRFQDAKLNPNLMYGQGTHGNATQMPTYQQPQIQNLEMGNPVMDMYNTGILQEQKRNVSQQNSLLRAETALKVIDASIKGAKDPKTGKMLDVVMKEYQNDYQRENVNKVMQEVSNLTVTKQLLEKDMTHKQIQIEDAQIEKAMKSIDKKWMEENHLSRLDPTLVKMLWRYANQAGKGLQWALQHFMTHTNQKGRDIINYFKD